MSVPAVGRLEGDRLRRQAERIQRQLIGFRVSLEDLDRVDRQDGVEQRAQARAVNERIEHRRRSVGQNGGLESALPQNCEDFRNFRERLEAEIELHQPRAQPRRLEFEAVEREVERVAGDPPEIGIAALQGSEPGILQLLVAPQRRQRCALLRREVIAALGGGGEIEQSTIGVENAGADSFETMTGQCDASFSVRRIGRARVLENLDPLLQHVAFDARIGDRGSVGEAR